MMKLSNVIPKKRLIFLAVTAMMLNVIGMMIVTSREPVQGDPLVIATSVINILLFTMQLLLAIHAHPFSFDMMFWLFSLFFFGYVPLLQHLANSYAWDLTPTFSEVIRTNLYVLLWSACYIFARDHKIRFISRLGRVIGRKLQPAKDVCKRWLRKKVFNPIMNVQKRAVEKSRAMSAAERRHFRKRKALKYRIPRMWREYLGCDLKTKFMDVLLIVAILLAVFDLITVGIVGQVSRSTAEIGTGNTMLDLILLHGLNNSLLFIATLHIVEAKKKRKIDAKTVIAIVCFVLACFPTGLARNMMASFYAGMLILMIDQTHKGRWFSWVILAGLVLVFPAAEIFRRISTLEGGNLLEIVMDSLQSSYLGGHYDAHQMMITVKRYVDEFGLSWGRQLLGALLFFVPRAIWPGKPEGTGHTAIVALDQFYFSNVSATMPAEGYVNFGILGIALFAIITGMATRKLDRTYWRKNKELKLIDILYPYSMFMFFFLLRGDMMSAGAYTIAQCVVGALIYGFYKCGVFLSEEMKNESP